MGHEHTRATPTRSHQDRNSGQPLSLGALHFLYDGVIWRSPRPVAEDMVTDTFSRLADWK
jgi:hypothetical protein